ncbi:MAG: efflux RND transporter periplasmic adaptor subunit [Verrucomicrobiales bacterium]|nr:efflux RND transporter periplasmic adaptor subunit [Verrucomicrobiales bacterium]
MTSPVFSRDPEPRTVPVRRRGRDLLLVRSSLALASAALALTTGCHESASSRGPAVTNLVHVTVARPIPRSMSEWDEFTGRLAAPETVEIRARVSGYVEKVHFREGSEVDRGDLLFTVDPRPYRAQLERAEAELERAKYRAELAKSEAERAKSLFQTRAISADDFDQRTQSAAETAAAVRSAEAAAVAARLDVEFTEVRAPIRGRIGQARVTAGNLVTAGTTGATLLATLVSVDPMYCYLEVDERSALRYRQLQRKGTRDSEEAGRLPAEVELADETGFPRHGFLDFIDNQLNPTTGTIRVRAVIPNPDRAAAPGFFARVRIPAGVDYQGQLVRDVAIGNDQGRPFVWVVDSAGTALPRPLALGPLVDGLRAVRSGLTAEDQVVINGLSQLRPGLKVHLELVDMLPSAGPTNTTTTAAHP